MSTLRYFTYKHLPATLQEVSKPIAELAGLMMFLPSCTEREVGMRKLLEAKDCFIRAKLEDRDWRTPDA